ncbi:MAG: SfiI family type II restriction endonuclease [Ectothiorhodospiraceae bacterium AqS1]|nr:SfiI family type II restriction endonuclease [Ectothiorhodospiraceae bacterium AqS1]
MSLVVQALSDYRTTAMTVFSEETDLPQDIAEDVTREAIKSMGVSSIHDRLYGKVDVKKAIYMFLPEPVPVALMLDAKAERRNGDQTATIQMSQTSMRVRMIRVGQVLDEPGRIDPVIQREHRIYQVVTIVAKYVYEYLRPGQKLHRIIVACIPNGRLQDIYNPNADDTIWLAGRNAPSR